MPFFARRTLQRLLTECLPILPAARVSALANAFNSDHKSSLAAQWELVLISALRSLGRLEYEPDTGGGRKLDLVLHSSLNAVPVGLEITAVSDDHNRMLHPFDAFQQELARRIEKVGLKPAGFHSEIGAIVVTHGKKRRYVMGVPRPSAFADFFDREFDTFLRDIARDGRTSRSFRRWSDSSQVEITYTPYEEYMTASYAGGDDNDVRDNSVFRAAEDKAAQIRGSGFGGPAGIVVCDAGAPLFRQDPHSYQVNLQRSLTAFLAEHQEVSFIIAVRTRVRNVSFKGRKPPVEVYVNATSSCSDQLCDALRSLGEQLPKLQCDALNVRRLLAAYQGKKGSSHYSWLGEGGTDWMKVRISARSVVQFLAAVDDPQKLLATAGLVESPWNPHPINPFREAYEAHERLVGARLVETPDDDDDWIEFEFQGQDPAWGPLTPG